MILKNHNLFLMAHARAFFEKDKKSGTKKGGKKKAKKWSAPMARPFFSQ